MGDRKAHQKAPFHGLGVFASSERAGYLIVGSHEALPSGDLGLTPSPSTGCAHRKNPRRPGWRKRKHRP